MYYILNSYNKVSWKKENIKKVIRENTFMTFIEKKKSTYKGTHAAETCAVQGSTIHAL